MIRFIKLKINREVKLYTNLKYIADVYYLIKKYDRFLNDDYARQENMLDEVITLIERTSPYFWIVLNNDEFAGFIFLENFIGNSTKLHSAEITTCFIKKYWGDFTKKVGRKFIRYCFKKYGLKKLKALVFKENYRVEALLKVCGMQKEAVLKSETLKNGKLQDVCMYSIINKR